MMDSKLLLVLVLFVQLNFTHQQQQPDKLASLGQQQANSLEIKARNANQSSSTAAEQQAGIDAILSDTFMLLDVLEQKLASAGNKTPNALMRENLRALDGAGEGLEVLNAVRDPRERLEAARLIAATNPSVDDETLVRFADSVALERISEFGPVEPMLAAASNEQSMPSAVINQSENPAPTLDGKAMIAQPQLTAAASISKAPAEGADGSVWGTNGRVGKLIQQAAAAAAATAAEEHQTASADSTEQHLKFTLHLMQSIFSSQSYSAKTNLIESFLISPLSIQTVLMMMHLGARGQTRREIGQCLHLTPSSLTDPGAAFENNAKLGPHQPLVAGDPHSEPSSTSSSESVKLLKRRTNQQQIPSPLGANSGETGQQQQQQQQQQQTPANGNAHELFGSAVRNLLKDPIVMKALTSANQIFLQKNLPLAHQYERAIKHYYAADVKLVDFQRQSSAESGELGGGGSQQHQHSTSLEKGKQHSVSAAPSSSEGNIGATMPSSHANYNANSSAAANSSSSAEAHFGARGSAEQLNNVQQLVNEWVERQSRGKISNFLASPVPASTLMMAINVLYYKGDWQYKFDPSGTENNAHFTQVTGKTVEMPMMVDTLPLAYAHDPVMKTSVIELPYKAQRLGLFLLLPDEVSGIFHTMQMLNSTSFANLIASMRKQTPSADGSGGASGISVRIPKFNIDSSPRLSHVLSQHLGLKTLFSPDMADLSGMFTPPQQVASKRPTGNVTNNQSNGGHKNGATSSPAPPQVGLDEFLHKAVLQVDEHGSVAAASSAIMLERVGNGNGNYFEADHPFLLFLMDKQTGLVLFSGVFAGNNNGEEREVKQHQQHRHQRHL